MKKLVSFILLAILLCNTFAVFGSDTDNIISVYKMDFESFETNDNVNGIDKTSGTQNVVVETNGNHHYRLTGPGSSNILMWYHHNDFAPDTVVQADYRVSGLTEPATILLRDVNGESEDIYIGTNGKPYYTRKLYGVYNKKYEIGSTSCKDNWVNIALAFHFNSRTYDVYINGEKEATGIGFLSDSFTSDMYHVRFILDTEESSGATLDIDNVYIYKSNTYYPADRIEGPGGGILEADENWEHEIDLADITPKMELFTAVTDTPLNNPTSRLTDYSEAKQAYNDAICFAAGTSNIWIKNGKYTSQYDTLIENEKLLVAAPVLAALKNATYSQSGGTATVGNVSATAGNSYISVDGTNISTSVPVRLNNGVVYIPLEEFAIYGMKKWYGASFLGFGVIANEPCDVHYQVDSCRPILHTVGNTSHMMAYLLLDRPNTTKLSSIFSGFGSRQRPYATMNQSDISAIRALSTSNAMAGEYSDIIIQNANELLRAEYTSKDDAGVQVAPVFGWTDAWTLYWAYVNTNNEAYVAKAEEFALQMANLSHWSGNFHILQTAQAMVSASYFYDLFYNNFPKSTKDALANAIINKGFLVAKSYYEGSTEGIQNDWCTRCTNWNAVPNSAILIAASTLMGEGYNDSLCLEMMERAFVSLGYFMQYFAPDGGTGEGIGYTSFTLSYLCPAIDVLQNVFGTDFGISDYPGLMKSGQFLAQATSFKYSYTLNDDSAEGYTNMSPAYWFAEKNNDTALANEILRYFDENTILKNAYAASVLPYMFSFNEDTAGELPLDSVYNGTELAFSRDSRKGKGTFIGVHGGHNHVAHGMYDYGTFVYDAFGIRFATEVGADLYSLDGIGSFVTNSGYYTVRAEGHNVYVANPDETAGQNRYTYGRIEVQEQKEKGVIYTLDMLPAYSHYVSSAKRGYMLTNDRKVFVLQDEITPINSQETFSWFWHTYADIDIDSETNTVILTRDYKKVKLYFDATVDLEISQSAAVPLPTSPDMEGQLQLDAHKNMKKIIVNFKGNGSPIKFRVIAEPVGQEYPRGELIPISSWSIPDGSYDDAFYSKADEIRINGQLIDNFDADVYDYTVSYKTIDELPPQVTASSLEGIVTVTQAETSGDTAVVKVQDRENSNNYKIYTITLISSGSYYYDFDFDQSGDTDNNWNNKVQGSSFPFYSFANTTQVSPITSLVTDPVRNSKVLEVNIPQGAASGGFYALGTTNDITDLGDKTTWYELSFKFENEVKGITLLTWNNFFDLQDNGDVYVGGLKDFSNANGDKITNFKAEADKWYHLVMAVDYVDTVNGAPKLYAWINGELLKVDNESSRDYTMIWNTTTALPKDVIDDYSLRVSSNKAGKVLFDNIKLYTSRNSVSADNYDPNVAMAGTALSTNLVVTDGIIYVGKTTTLADVNDSIAADGCIVFTDAEGNVLTENLSSITAVGSFVNVVSVSGIGVKTYPIVQKVDVVVKDTYYDVDFNDGDNTNEADSNYAFYPFSGNPMTSYVDDVIKGSGIARYAPSTQSIVGMPTVGIAGIDSCTTWYEMSFCYDKELFNVHLLTGAPIFQLKSDGKIYVGGLEGFGSANGYEITNATLEVGKWYNIKIAIDWIDSEEAGGLKYPKLYAWLNGELLTTESSSDCTTVWSNSMVAAYDRVSIKWLELTMTAPNTSGAAIEIDDFKIYTASSPVRDSLGYMNVDFSDDYAHVSSDTMSLVDNIIYTPVNATLGNVVSALTLANAGKILDGTGAEVTAQNTTPANGKTIYIQSANGVGVREYTVSNQMIQIDASSANWSVKDSKSILTADIINKGKNSKEYVLIVAVYNPDDNSLYTSSMRNISLVPGKNTITSKELDMEDVSGYSVRAFLWESMSNLVPATDSKDIPVAKSI